MLQWGQKAWLLLVSLGTLRKSRAWHLNLSRSVLSQAVPTRHIRLSITWKWLGGQPRGTAVKSTPSALAAQGSPIWIPGVDLGPVAGTPWGRWAQMLAQGQSSSAKRGGLVADVSSGLNFLKKKRGTVSMWPGSTSSRWSKGGFSQNWLEKIKPLIFLNELFILK